MEVNQTLGSEVVEDGTALWTAAVIDDDDFWQMSSNLFDDGADGLRVVVGRDDHAGAKGRDCHDSSCRPKTSEAVVQRLSSDQIDSAT